MKNNYFSQLFVMMTLLLMADMAHATDKPRKTHLHTAKVSASFKNVQFAFNKISIPGSAYGELNRAAKLVSDSGKSLKVSGYADNRGGYVYNWKLSQKRAEVVRNYLISKGADSTKIAAVEFGYTHPVASNKTAAGRQKNRRVELSLVN